MNLKNNTKVCIRHKSEMTPLYIDNIGRYHFTLHDKSDIVFNKQMESLSGKYCLITNLYKYIGVDNNVYFTFQLIDINSHETYPYTFTIDMVNIIE